MTCYPCRHVSAPTDIPSMKLHAICFDWGGTLMAEHGPADRPMAEWPTVQAIAGAAPTLAALSARWPLYLATNASQSDRRQIVQALQRVGLAHFFQDIFCWRELRMRKHEPAFWQQVAARVGAPATALAMVGDSLEHDVRAPAALGLHAVWYCPDAQRPDPTPAVPRVARLTELVSHFAQRAG